MAGEVVGSVHINVHGNTEPLGDDIRRAAQQASTTIDNNIDPSNSITDNIVRQIRAAEGPARIESRRLGRIISEGIQSGIRDNPVWHGLREDFNRLGTDFSASLSSSMTESLTRIRQQMQELRDEMANMPPIPPPGGPGGPGGPGPGGGPGPDEENEPGPGPAPDEDENHVDPNVRRLRTAVSGGIFDAIFKMIAGKIAVMGVGISAGIRMAVPAIAGLAAQVSSLGAALGAAGTVGAAAFATMIPGVAALKIAFAGMDAEAKKALTERFTAASGDLAGFKERVRNEVTPALIEATKTVSKLAPEINQLGTEAAEAGGKIANMFARMLVGRKDEIGNIFGNADKVMIAFGRAGARAFDVIINALDALQPLVDRITKSFNKGTGDMFDNLNKKIDSGAFLETMTKWYDAAAAFGRGLKNVGIVLANVFGAAADSQADFGESFEKLTEKWAEWSESFEGQNQIKKVFDEAKPVIEEVWGLLGDIAGLFTQSFVGDTSGVVDFIKMLREDVIPGIEDFQRLLRESGVQEALYDLAKAFGSLFTAGGGQGMAAFLTMMATLVSTAAKLLDMIGPLIGPLLAFAGAMRAIGLAKAGLGGVGALLTRAVTPLAGILGAGAAARFAGFTGAMSGVAGALGPVATGFFVAQTAAKVFQDRLKDPEGALQGMIKQLEKGKTSVEALAKVDVPQGWLTTGLEGASTELNGLKEIIDDLGGDKSGFAGFARDLAHFGFDLTGINASREAMDLAFQAIQQYARSTGDWQGAQDNLNLLTEALDAGGVEADEYADSLAATATAIDETATAAGAAGGRFTGLFEEGAGQKGLDQFGDSFDANITQKINDLYKNQNFIDIKTGGLNLKGLEAREAILQDISFRTVNTVEDAISEARGDEIREVYLDPKMIDKTTGELNELGIKKVQGILVEAVPENKAAVDKKRDLMNRVWKVKPLTIDVVTDTFGIGEGISEEDIQKLKDDKKWDALKEVATVGLQLYVPDVEIGDIDNQVEARFASRLLTRRIELEAIYKDPKVVERMLADEAKTILIEVGTTEAKQTLLETFGAGGEDGEGSWLSNLSANAKITPEVGKEKIFEWRDELYRVTMDAEGRTKIELVVGEDEEAYRATYNNILELTEGPGGGMEWSAGVAPVVEEEPKSEAERELNALTTDRDVKIFPKIQAATLGPSGGTSYTLSPGTGGQQAGGNMFLPPAEVTAPSMISMGGPTTMGASAGSMARGGITVGVVPNKRQVYRPGDEPKATNVTINNYYPEPERASETVAMSMRVARYA